MSPKQTARQVIDNLPDDATWDEVVYRMVTRREIELGLVQKDIQRRSAKEEPSGKSSAMMG